MKTHQLKHPIEIKNAAGEVVETISSITLNRLKGRDARKITTKEPMAMTVQMIGLSAGLPPSTMDLMDMEDIIGAAEVAVDFFGNSLLTGAKS